jgi:hypothetical protein
MGLGTVSPVEPANDLTGLRIADEHSERAKVVVSGLAQIIGAQTIANYRCVSGTHLIGDGDVRVYPETVIRHIRLPVAGLDPAACVFSLLIIPV